MLKEFMWLQVITVVVTLPVYQHATKLENELTSSDPEILTTVEHETESFLGLITDFNNESTKEIPLGPVLRQTSQRTETTIMTTVTSDVETKGTDILNQRSVIEEKKKAKNPFPFYAYILFGLVPLFIIFILLR